MRVSVASVRCHSPDVNEEKTGFRIQMMPVCNAGTVGWKAQGLDELSRAHQGFLTGQKGVRRARLRVSYAAEDNETIAHKKTNCP